MHSLDRVHQFVPHWALLPLFDCLSMGITMSLFQMMMGAVKGHSDPSTAQGQYFSRLPSTDSLLSDVCMLAGEFQIGRHKVCVCHMTQTEMEKSCKLTCSCFGWQAKKSTTGHSSNYLLDRFKDVSKFVFKHFRVPFKTLSQLPINIFTINACPHSSDLKLKKLIFFPFFFFFWGGGGVGGVASTTQIFCFIFLVGTWFEAEQNR